MNNTPSKISVVIPSWNGAEILPSTLMALSETLDPNFEVLIVDHGKSSEATRELVDSYIGKMNIRYLGLLEQLGFAGAVNFGVGKSSGEIIAVICNDVIVEPNWLVAVRERFNACLPTRNPILFSYVVRNLEGGVELGDTNIWMRAIFGSRDKASDFFFHPDGSCFFFSKSFYGMPFDSEYFLYQEDVYFGWKAWLRGEQVEIVRQSKVKNIDGGTTKRTPIQTSYFTERNRWWNYFLFFEASTLFRITPLLISDFLFKIVFGKNRLAKLRALKDVILSWRNLREKRKVIQMLRKREDKEILSLLSFQYQQKGIFLNRFFSAFSRILGFSPKS
jgi:GT2 family glycosyltransferase